MNETVTPRPASTLALLREHDGMLQVLLVQRNAELRFAAGAWVFPGGAVDAADYLGAEEAAQAARHAAVRETHEETGLTVDASCIAPLSHWTTPCSEKRRFSTWIFVAPLADTVHCQPVVDGSEIIAARWLAPAEALREQRVGDLALMPPTLVTLRDLARFDDIAAVMANTRQRQVPSVVPVLCHYEGTVHLLLPGDCGYAQARPDAEGPRHRAVLGQHGWCYRCDPACGRPLDQH